MTRPDTNIIEFGEVPILERYAVGDCEMLLRQYGNWINVDDVSKLLDWLTDNDDRDVILAKIKHIQDIHIL